MDSKDFKKNIKENIKEKNKKALTNYSLQNRTSRPRAKENIINPKMKGI